MWHKLFGIAGLSLILIGLLAACGGDSGNPQNAAPTRAIDIPTYSFTDPTATAAPATAAATRTPTDIPNTATAVPTVNTATPTEFVIDPTAVARGSGRYEALECGSCHGANGEGTDKGGSLLTYGANETDFITFMRSGGTVGTSHQYATNRLSESGAENLYQYLLSLQQ